MLAADFPEMLSLSCGRVGYLFLLTDTGALLRIEMAQSTLPLRVLSGCAVIQE